MFLITDASSKSIQLTANFSNFTKLIAITGNTKIRCKLAMYKVKQKMVTGSVVDKPLRFTHLAFTKIYTCGKNIKV